MDVETEPRGMDAGEPRLILSSHRALSDGLGGFVNPSDIRALEIGLVGGPRLCGQHGPADAVVLRLRGDLLDRAERLDADGSYRYRFTGARPGVLRFID